MNPNEGAGEALKPDQELAGLLLPMQGAALILPNEAIAEVVGDVQAKPVSGGPVWMAGMFAWRGLSLPLISYERLNGRPSRIEMAGVRATVINGLGGDSRLPFFGLITSGLPRPFRVRREELALRDGKKGPADVMLVRAQDANAAIPNLLLIEKMLLRQLHSAEVEA